MGCSITTTGQTEIGRTHVVKLWMVQADPIAEFFNSKLEHHERFNGIASLIGLVADSRNGITASYRKCRSFGR